MAKYLSESQFRKLETASRIFLTLAVVAFILVAVDTKQRMDTIENKIENGKCSYLVNKGVVTTGEGDMSYEQLQERNFLPEEPAARNTSLPE